MISNYLLIETKGHPSKESTVVVVTKEFLDGWIKHKKKVKRKQDLISKLKHDVKSLDDADVTYIWLPTDKKVDRAGKSFMKDFKDKIEEGFEL
jgi:hypothetical protein